MKIKQLEFVQDEDRDTWTADTIYGVVVSIRHVLPDLVSVLFVLRSKVVHSRSCTSLDAAFAYAQEYHDEQVRKWVETTGETATVTP